MNQTLLIGGSVAGAFLAGFVARAEPGRAFVAALTGLTSGLLGILVWAGGGTTTPLTQAGTGLVSALAPLTLCTVALDGPAAGRGVIAGIRQFGTTLAVSLIYGIGCASVGFASVGLIRHIFHGGGYS
jgi:hypothetical protein